MKPKFCVTLTTIPSRLSSLDKTIKSIEDQTLRPNKIFLNIPIKYHRFPKTEIRDSELEKFKSNLVEVTRCEDYGPATKIMGSLNKMTNYECAIIIDDDHIYNQKMCEIFLNEFEKKKINYSYYIQKIFDLKMAQCADGFLIKVSLLDNIKKFYINNVKDNKNLLYDDDLWVSIYLQKIMKSDIKNLIEKFEDETGQKIIYSIHSSIDGLSQKIHSPKKFINRRKIAKIEYIKFSLKKFLSKN